MKLSFPENLKNDAPQSTWNKVLSTTPIIMTVIATMLAGLSSSEMTKAQYDRSLAAQLQSKAGDQWSYFQAKRLRSALQRTTLDLLLASGQIQPLTASRLKDAAASLPIGLAGDRGGTELLATLDSVAGVQALSTLATAELSSGSTPAPIDPAVKEVLNAAESTKTDAEIAGVVGKLDDLMLTNTLRAAREHAGAFDAAITPINQTIDTIDGWFAQAVHSDNAPVFAAVARDFTAARLRFAMKRYDAEARLNQSIASLYELQVRKNNLSAERHHARSQRFFYGMLAAQMGVIISTFAMAARKKSLLWALATAAGLAAVVFAAYVYLYV